MDWQVLSSKIQHFDWLSGRARAHVAEAVSKYRKLSRADTVKSNTFGFGRMATTSVQYTH